MRTASTKRHQSGLSSISSILLTTPRLSVISFKFQDPCSQSKTSISKSPVSSSGRNSSSNSQFSLIRATCWKKWEQSQRNCQDSSCRDEQSLQMDFFKDDLILMRQGKSLLNWLTPKASPQSQLVPQRRVKQAIDQDTPQFIEEPREIPRNKSMANPRTLPIVEDDLTSDDFVQKTPVWATKEFCKDKAGRRPSDPNYDCTSLFVPQEQFRRLTPTMKQYWKFKSQHFDKIVLFKLGKFYQLFYEDAQVSHDLLDLKWMGKKMHTGFPEKTFQRYTRQFVASGYKVVVVQQMETPDEMAQRVKQQKSEKVIRREVTQVLTKGTYVPVEQNYSPKLLLAIFQHKEMVSAVLYDASVNFFYMAGTFSSQLQYLNFRTILYQSCPVEILYIPGSLDQKLQRIIKAQLIGAVLTTMPDNKGEWHPGVSLNFMKSTFGANQSNWPEVIRRLIGNRDESELSCLSGIISYLQKILVLNSITEGACCFMSYGEVPSRSLVLDSQAVHHLQLLFLNYDDSEDKNTLFGYLQRTASPFGKRLLRRWMLAPLVQVEIIKQRQEAVKDLHLLRTQRNQFIKLLKKSPDLQRVIARLCKYTARSSANDAVYFSDVNGSRFKQLKEVLQSLGILSKGTMDIFRNTNFTSPLLQKLVTTQDQQRIIQQENSVMMPSIHKDITEVFELLDWRSDPPKPKRQCCLQYGAAIDQIQVFEGQLKQLLARIRKQVGDYSISYVHVKNRYEIEVPARFAKEMGPQFQFSSSKAGVQRFTLKESRKLVQQLERAQEKLKKVVNGYSKEVFKLFASKRGLWNRFVDCLAQVDCLVALSLVSQEEGMCCPVLQDFTVEPFLQIKAARHPCLQAAGFKVIPNDIVLKNHKFILLTGPNMGGKSTFMRTAAVLVVLAQMGCFVPAASYHGTVKDRIFTRLGASDQLLLGKSTFMIELQQTRNMIQLATKHSLGIIDQLGRGTSTKDGIAIAYAVLKHLSERVSMLGFFATHFHLLLQVFQGSQTVRICRMGSKTKEEQLIFSYELEEGGCRESVGVEVARMAGLDRRVLDRITFV